MSLPQDPANRFFHTGFSQKRPILWIAICLVGAFLVTAIPVLLWLWLKSPPDPRVSYFSFSLGDPLWMRILTGIIAGGILGMLCLLVSWLVLLWGLFPIFFVMWELLGRFREKKEDRPVPYAPFLSGKTLDRHIFLLPVIYVLSRMVLGIYLHVRNELPFSEDGPTVGDGLLFSLKTACIAAGAIVKCCVLSV